MKAPVPASLDPVVEEPTGNAESRTWSDAQFGNRTDPQTRLDVGRLKGAIQWLDAVEETKNVARVL